MKPCLLGVTALFLCLGLGACSGPTDGQEPKPLEISDAKKVFSVAEPPKYEKEVYPFLLSPGEYFGEAVVQDEAIYFESGNYTITDVATKTTICKKEGGSTEVLYTEEREDGGRVEVTELKLAGHMLFWSCLDSEELSIRAYDLLEREVETIAAYPAEEMLVLILEADDRFLTWYAVPLDGAPSLSVFDTEDHEIQCLSDHIGYDNPYSRAYVQDGVTSYIESTAEQQKKITIYDLEADQEINSYLLPDDLELAAVQANRDHVMLRTGYDTTGIYILDEKKNELQELDYSSHPGIYPFSWHLMGNRVFINSHGRDSYPDELVLLSLDTSTLSSIPLEKNAVSGAVREPSQYSVQYASAGDADHREQTVAYFRFDR